MNTHGANLTGWMVNPGNDITSGYFEYGLTIDYGTQLTIDNIPAFGTDVLIPDTFITELEAETQYHVRLVVTNSIGTTISDDVTFATLADNVVIVLPTITIGQVIPS